MSPRTDADMPSKCLVTAADYARWWTKWHALRLVPPLQPESIRCLWCGSDDVDPRYAPLCSARCVVASEVD